MALVRAWKPGQSQGKPQVNPRFFVGNTWKPGGSHHFWEIPGNSRWRTTVCSVGKITFILVKQYSHIFEVPGAVWKRYADAEESRREMGRCPADSFTPGKNQVNTRWAHSDLSDRVFPGGKLEFQEIPGIYKKNGTEGIPTNTLGKDWGKTGEILDFSRPVW